MCHQKKGDLGKDVLSSVGEIEIAVVDVPAVASPSRSKNRHQNKVEVFKE